MATYRFTMFLAPSATVVRIPVVPVSTFADDLFAEYHSVVAFHCCRLSSVFSLICSLAPDML